MILVVPLYFVLATTFLFAKYSLDYSKPFFLIGFRMIVAGALLLGYLLATDWKSLRISRGDWPKFFKVSLTHVYLAFMCEFWALSFPSMSSAKTNLIFSATPFITAFLSYTLLKERFSLKKMFAMVVGFAGLIPIMFFQTEPLEMGAEFFKISFPEGILMIAVFSAAYAWFDIKKLMEKGYSLLLVNGFAMLTGGIGAMLTSAATEGFYPAPVSDWNMFLLWVMILIATSNLIFYNFYGYLLQRYSITFISFSGCLTPIFGGALGWYFRGEQITGYFFMSLGIIITALFMFYQDEMRVRFMR